MADQPLKAVTSSTTVKQIDDAIAIWNKVGHGSNSSKAHIEHLKESRLKLINILQRDYTKSLSMTSQDFKSGYGPDPVKIQEKNQRLYKQGLIGLMKDEYKPLSLEELNKLNQKYLNLNTYEEHQADEISSKSGKVDNVIDFFEGKKGINLTTVIKTSLFTAGIAALHQVNTHVLIQKIAVTLWAANPVIAVCAGVLALAGLAKAIGKVFGPELKNLVNTHKMNRNFGTAQAENSISDFDANKIIEEQEKIDKETSEREAKEKAEQAKESKQKTDFAAEIGSFNPNSIEEVEAFIAKYDKIPTEVNNAIKTSSIKFGQMFKAEAFNLVRTGKQNEVGNLRARFSNFLSAADMDNLQKSAGIEEKGKEDFSHEFEQVKNDETSTNNTNSDAGAKSNKDSFDAFKTSYNAIVGEIVKNTNPAKTMKEIKTLEDFINNPTNFNVQGNPKAQESENLKTLCSKMIQMLNELQEQVVAKGATFTDEKDAKDKIAQAHNLNADDLDKLLQ